MTRKLAAFAVGTMLLAVSCSKTADTVTAAPPAQASSGSKVSETTTTEESTTTNKSNKTSTTKKSTGTTRGSGKKDPKIEKIIAAQKQTVSKAGSDLTDKEMTCLEQYLTDNPDILDVLNNPSTKDDYLRLFDMISSCFDKEKFIDTYVLANSKFTTQQQVCLRPKLLKLTVDQFAGLAAQDPDTLAALGPSFVDCM